MPVLQMPVLEIAGTGKCRYWKMPVLEIAGTENAGTGKCRYWKMTVLENAGTAVLPMQKFSLFRLWYLVVG